MDQELIKDGPLQWTNFLLRNSPANIMDLFPVLVDFLVDNNTKKNHEANCSLFVSSTARVDVHERDRHEHGPEGLPGLPTGRHLCSPQQELAQQLSRLRRGLLRVP